MDNNTEKCVHTEHCCAKNGCKYGDIDCPVWLGHKKQSYPYWDGCSEAEEEIPTISEEIYKARRREAYDRYDFRDSDEEF